MSTKSKRQGTDYETHVCRFMSVALGQPDIERRALHGVNDMGDIFGIDVHGFECIAECKAVRDSRIEKHRAETLRERDAAGADIGILVCAGYSAPSAAFPDGRRLPTRLSTVHITLRDLAMLVPELMLAEGMEGGGDAFWVQMTLAEFCLMATD